MRTLNLMDQCIDHLAYYLLRLMGVQELSGQEKKAISLASFLKNRASNNVQLNLQVRFEFEASKGWYKNHFESK